MSSRRSALDSLSVSSDTHAGLWLEKCLSDVAEKGPGRQEHFRQLDRLSVPAEYRRFFQRWRDSVQALQPYTETAEATVQGRMVVGLGAESVLETAIMLHRAYGVPYIPGSALKGLAAAAAHKHLEDPKWRKLGEDGKIGEWHHILFGDQEASGYVTFHDALWIPNGERFPLDLDVMTVHHPDYYQGSSPPSDCDSPNPVAFVSARGRYLLALTGPKEWASTAMNLLVEALENDGIGAKTAAGYGRLTVPKPQAIPWESMLQGRLGFDNAPEIVSRILQATNGQERQKAARAIIEKLDRKALKKKKDKEWVQRLFEAEGK